MYIVRLCEEILGIRILGALAMLSRPVSGINIYISLCDWSQLKCECVGLLVGSYNWRFGTEYNLRPNKLITPQ